MTDRIRIRRFYAFFAVFAATVLLVVQRALQSMSSLAPQKNPQLHAAAPKDPSCQRLRALG